MTKQFMTIPCVVAPLTHIIVTTLHAHQGPSRGMEH